MPAKLTREAIEFIHDVLVASVLHFDEKTGPDDYRNRSLIESAVARPYRTAFGEELFPSAAEKAAALFHSLVCNHCFLNGNKRTAVLALDIQLVLSGLVLTLSSEQVYHLSKETAQANALGITPEQVLTNLANTFRQYSRPLDELASDILHEGAALAQTRAASLVFSLGYLLREGELAPEA